MKIKKIISQSRRDFKAIYECESCGHEHNGSGYDDANFHENVIPDMICKECGAGKDSNYRALTTKYTESQVI
jgi:transcription elongation factor Elf1